MIAKLEQDLLRAIGRANKTFELIAPNDHIMVAVSGGKDSWSLLDLLLRYQRIVPFDFTLMAVTLDQGQPGFDAEDMKARYEQMGVPYHIEFRDTYSVVKEKTPEGKAYCALCSRMRRGILYQLANRFSVTKIALGHHRDDFIETLLLNQFYSGRTRSMGVRLIGDDSSPEIIRPMVYISEADLIAYAHALAFPIIPCNLCGSQDGLKRQEIKQLLHNLEQTNPRIRGNLISALGNIDLTHMLVGTSTRIPDSQEEMPLQIESGLVQLTSSPAKN